ncbi:HepT-like ribonuclease domain-containing protein [Mesonia aestuariivivens]|uniref:DUF86 domain-containing protein n=1 Tax=Mesonia aestuariivivens TaxID=2796128 RepID=A0ABS6W6C3_9FLAO|nr:HepT-like ribonuclease domain-containing protein [Mesonia aestuariivivens]MBW2963041.1 DUF86 domain-containing protein [Mesonia aestuariivivens]
MDERILKWLYDIHFAFEEIESYFENTEKHFFEYRKNTMLKRAVERDLEIIGEAVNRILKRDPNFEKFISNAKAIIGLRNQVIHAYDNISDENIWSIIINHIPKLRKEVESLIAENK